MLEIVTLSMYSWVLIPVLKSNKKKENKLSKQNKQNKSEGKILESH